MKFITIRSSHDINELVILKSMLENAGIPCHLKNELTTQVMNFLPSMEVELQVAEDHLEQTVEVMKEFQE